MASLKMILRTAQVHCPALLEFRHGAHRLYRRLTRQPHEPDFALLARYSFEPDDVLVDAGANRGQSIDSMRLFCPHQPIVSFEPNARLAARLRRTFAKDPNVSIEATALGETEGRFTFQVPSYRGWAFDGQGTLNFGPQNFEYLRSGIIGFNESQLSVETMEVSVRRLDEFGIKAKFIKIDVEGNELAVVRGAAETLRRYRPILMIENSAPAEVSDFLYDFGYVPYHWFIDDVRPGVGDYRNTLYIHQDSALHSPGGTLPISYK